MAQMPASYLTEKVDDLRVGLASLDTGSGLIDLSDYNRTLLTGMARNAQAILNEIAEWTEKPSGGTVAYGDGQPIPHDAPPAVHAQAMAEAFDRDMIAERTE
jgi:hypothetical protein